MSAHAGDDHPGTLTSVNNLGDCEAKGDLAGGHCSRGSASSRHAAETSCTRCP